MAARTISEKQMSRPEVRMVSAVQALAKAASPWSDHVVEGFYGRIAVRETHGQGLPIVLLHGETSTKDVFRPQMLDALGARHRMLAIDLPGYGSSDAAADAGGSTLTVLADAVIDTVERLGIEQFALLGWSLGGHVALEVAASTPGAVGVMVVGTSLQDPVPGVCVQAADGETNTREGLDRLDNRVRADILRHAAESMTAEQRSLAFSLSLPLAVVDGANDPAKQPGSIAPTAYPSLWEGRVHSFPLAGRAPFLDAPDLFNSTLARFLHHLESAPQTAPRLCLAG